MVFEALGNIRHICMQQTFNYVTQDWKANFRNPKARFILICFRLARQIRNSKRVFRIAFSPFLLFYKVVIESLLSVEIPWGVSIGENLKIYHGHGIVVHTKAVLGKNCSIRHTTTIGARGNDPDGNDVPVIGDFVDIGCHVVILGGIKIGNNVKIGAGSVVMIDVPENATVVGNPARIIANRRIDANS
jgi:putative colanic acid biosynthesis acetyltransferase WcaB